MFPRIFIAFAMFLLCNNTQADPNAQALQQLQSFLLNSKARGDFAEGNADAQRANRFMNSLPAHLQTEFVEVMMMVMREQGVKAAQYDKIRKKSGNKAAAAQLSPAVQARVKALSDKIVKHFGSESKAMKKMKKNLPN